MSDVTCHLPPVTISVTISLMPKATDPPLLTPPLSTLDWFQIQKALINHGQKILVKPL